MDAEKFDKLIVGYLEDLSGEEELQEFHQLLLQNESAREIYSGQAALHGVLTWLHQQPTLPSTEQEPAQSRLADSQSANASFVKRWMPSLLLAASIALLVTSLVISRNTEPKVGQQQDLARAGSSSVEDGSVARIVRKVDCDWEGDRWSVVSSSHLLPGQTLKMARGLMQLEFNSGAQVTLEAPVSFTIESAMRGVLAHGKLTAQIPETAHGFTVSTPNEEMVDLGTEFGLVVAQNGATETHVFEGEVIVRPDLSGKKSTDMHLTNDMALRIDNSQETPSVIDAAPKRFTQLKFEEKDKVIAPAVDRQLSLWFAADRRVQVDEANRVAGWGDLCTESNRTAENAWQVEGAKRPELVQEAIGGKPAVRFGRKNQLVTEPLKLGSAQTIAIVFRVNLPLLDKWGVGNDGRHLVNMNGPPHLLLHVNNKRHLISRNYTGFRANDAGKKNYVSVGRTISPKELDGEPVVAVSVYDPSIDSSRLYMNNVLVDEAKAPKLESTKSPRSIGSHPFLPNTHFFGDIGELMIYDTGLTDGEALGLSQSLMEKYGITASPIGD